MGTKEVRCIVTGRVQGVMYRDFVRRHARHHALAGTVRNLDDGSVEVLAQGPEEELMAFIKDLRRGSLFSRVGDVHITWRQPERLHSSFDIVF